MPREIGITQVISIRELDSKDFLMNAKITSPFIWKLYQLLNRIELIFN